MNAEDIACRRRRCGWCGRFVKADHLRAAVVDECVCNIGAQDCPVHPGRLRTLEQKIAVRKAWDARVPEGVDTPPLP